MKQVIFLLSMLIWFSSAKLCMAAADANFEDTYFSGSGQCSQCHDGISDNAGNDISIVKNWSTSMMANASRDPYWQAKVASELYRNPALSDEINEKCSRCHTPMATETAKKEGATIEIFDDGFLNPTNTYYDHALDGVSCSLCHQIAADGNLGTPAGTSGNYTIEEVANIVDRPAYGQYLAPRSVPMRNNVEFTPQYSAHISSSEICASCHDLKTPFVDADGNLASLTPKSEFPEQMVYSEWNNSAYKTGGTLQQTCQGCHMPKLEESVKIASHPENLPIRPGFSKHSFLGANTTMMDILDQNREALEVTADGFDQAISDSRQFLQSAAKLQIISVEFINTKLKITLKVENNTGHKLPSAYPSRRVFIHFVLRGNSGQILFESGKLNANGSIAGVASDVDPSTYEPHYELITAEDQVQVYEPIMQNTDNAITHTLLRAASYRKDNRLTPLGFDKNSVPADVAIKGAAMDDSDFNLGSDIITYLIEVGDTKDISILAELKYQTLSYGHLQDMFSDASEVPKVAAFKAQFEVANILSETLATATSKVGEVGTFFVIPTTHEKTIIFSL